MNRVAIVSTLLSGNTWLRVLLAQLYDLEQYMCTRPMPWIGKRCRRNAACSYIGSGFHRL
jgi:hypothetical protein